MWPKCWTLEVHFINGKEFTFTALLYKAGLDELLEDFVGQNYTVTVTTIEDVVISLAGSQIMLIKAVEEPNYEP